MTDRLETVRVYTADDCPHCDALRRDLDRRGVRFEEVNLSRRPERLEELRDHTWEHRLPVVVDHERVSIGFNGASSTFDELGLD